MRLSFAEAVDRALAAETAAPGPWGTIERLLKRRGRRHAHA
jgi:hypothetical protein